jgi:hypothetical protein
MAERMRTLYLGIAAFCLLVSSSSMTMAADAWKQGYQFPHLTEDYAGCENLAWVQAEKLMQTREIPASVSASIKKSMFTDMDARDVVRPMVQGQSVLIGLNLRGLGNRLCSNPVLTCASTGQGTCSEISRVAHNQVLQPLLVDEQTLVAQRDIFTGDNLNRGKSDFVFSRDKGKSWEQINTPVPCADPLMWCRLVPQTASGYFLMSTQVSLDPRDIAIHVTTDAGKSWTLLTEKWQGIDDVTAVSVVDDTFVGLLREPGEFVTLSRLTPRDKKIVELKTNISTQAWSPLYEGQVLDFEGGYLVRLNAANGAVPANRFGIVFVPAPSYPGPARLIWEADLNGGGIGDFQASDGVIAIRTRGPSLLDGGRKFAEKIHYSLDGGQTWKIAAVPAELLGAVMLLANRKLWLFTPDAVKYQDLTK